MKHKLTVTLASGDLHAWLSCEEGGTCSLWCLQAECEEGPSGFHHEHELHHIDCAYVEWWNADSRAAFEEGYTGPPVEPRSGYIFIEAANEDEGVLWHYESEETTP